MIRMCASNAIIKQKTNEDVVHYPQLDTVLMIENAIKKHNGEYTVTQLWKKLEKKVMYQTYKVAIDYLVESKKVLVKNKKLIWIFNPELMEKLIKESVEV